MRRKKTDDTAPGHEYLPLRPVAPVVKYADNHESETCVCCFREVKRGNMCDRCWLED